MTTLNTNNAPEVPDGTPMTAAQLDLLRTYQDGPRIWDAASVFGNVTYLASMGLIQGRPEHESVNPTNPAFELTDRGRRLLAFVDKTP